MLSHSQIVIIGGGPVGLTTALKLAKHNKSVVLIDKSFSYVDDGRVLALSYLSCNILRQAGVDFSTIPHTQINQVDISHRGLGISQIKHSELNLPKLGITIAYSTLCTQLLELVKQNSLITLVNHEVTSVKNMSCYSSIYFTKDNQQQIMTCDLLIMAEGGQLLSGFAKKRKYDYQQTACIFHINTKYPHNNIAYERFSNLGPLVLLPFEDHYVVVWSIANQLVNSMQANPNDIITMLDEEFTNRLGGAKLISTLKSYPLKLVQAKSRLDNRMVVIGNSAQALHPVSAQGLNLGLRDVQTLVSLLIQDNYLVKLEKYDQMRDFDVNSVINFTHLLATKLDYSQSSLMNHLRGFGLISLSGIPMIKNFVGRSLIFGLKNV